MIAEEELSNNDSQTVGASQDLIQATQIARRMVVEYGFGEIMKNTSLIGLQDYALTSGKEILDDIQKILDHAKTDAEQVISKNKDLLNRFIDKLVKEVLLNGDDLMRFFSTNPLNL